jgi:hypothetical protein
MTGLVLEPHNDLMSRAPVSRSRDLQGSEYVE